MGHHPHQCVFNASSLSTQEGSDGSSNAPRRWLSDKSEKRASFFFGGVTATAPSKDLTDNKKKRREGSSRGESKRKLLKETQNQGKETRKKKRTQVEYRVEGAQDRRRRRKPGGWKETPNTRKRSMLQEDHLNCPNNQITVKPLLALWIPWEITLI